jgi:hypothetical protein
VKDRRDGKTRKRTQAVIGRLYVNEGILEIERGRTRSHSVENWLW